MLVANGFPNVSNFLGEVFYIEVNWWMLNAFACLMEKVLVH